MSTTFIDERKELWTPSFIMISSLVSPREFKSVKTMNAEALHMRPNGIAIKLKKEAKNLKTGVRKQLIPILGRYLAFFISPPCRKIELQGPCNPRPKL